MATLQTCICWPDDCSEEHPVRPCKYCQQLDPEFPCPADMETWSTDDDADDE